VIEKIWTICSLNGVIVEYYMEDEVAITINNLDTSEVIIEVDPKKIKIEQDTLETKKTVVIFQSIEGVSIPLSLNFTRYKCQ
jgi:hypothetical protein